ncbi:MAG: GNAT family N-acetyltransferase, partial [bacterium]
MEYKIQQATTRDIEGLSLLLKAFRNEHSLLLSSNREYTLKEAQEEVKSVLEDPACGYFIIESDGEMAGFRRWELHEGFYFTREMYVREDMRGRGLAKAMIRHFENWVKNNGQGIACISCIPVNDPMIDIARSEGYDILNTIEMRKDLKGRNKAYNTVSALGRIWNVIGSSKAPDYSRKRADRQLPSVISGRHWHYHHMGIPTDKKMPGEKYIESIKCYVSGFENSPFGIEWMRFDNDSPVHSLIKSTPHIAFTVESIEKEIEENQFRIISDLTTPSEGVS